MFWNRLFILIWLPNRSLFFRVRHSLDIRLKLKGQGCDFHFFAFFLYSGIYILQTDYIIVGYIQYFVTKLSQISFVVSKTAKIIRINPFYDKAKIFEQWMVNFFVTHKDWSKLVNLELVGDQLFVLCIRDNIGVRYAQIHAFLVVLGLMYGKFLKKGTQSAFIILSNKSILAFALCTALIH